MLGVRKVLDTTRAGCLLGYLVAGLSLGRRQPARLRQAVYSLDAPWQRRRVMPAAAPMKRAAFLL